MVRRTSGALTAVGLVLAFGSSTGRCAASEPYRPHLAGADAGGTPAARPADAADTRAATTQETVTPEEAATLRARIAALIKQLGDNEWRVREAASDELLKIGHPAIEALTEAAAKSADPEVVWRAKDLIQRIPTVAPQKLAPTATNAFQVVSEGVEHIQTFKAAGDRIDSVRLRAARTINVPLRDLTVELRRSDTEGTKTLATGTLQANWIDGNGVQRGVSRFFSWFTVELKAEGLKKGETYELVVSSPTTKDMPWLVNCFLRDAYPDGEHRRRAGGKTDPPGKFDLVFEVRSGDAVAVTSVPKDVTLPDREPYGVGPDGLVPAPTQPAVPGGIGPGFF